MTIEIGGIQLQRIHRLQTLEQAAYVYQHVPGMAGDVTQHLGRNSVRLQIEGICYGEQAQAMLDQLRALYLKQQPVEFIADIVGQGYIANVTLDYFAVTQSADEPDQYSYALQVVEYVQPPKTGAGGPAVTAKIQADAKLMLDTATLPDALAFGSLPEISNPFEPLNAALDPVREAATGLSSSLSALRDLLGG